MRIDVNAWLGGYPFRKVEGGSAGQLLAAMDRTAITDAWVSWLPGILWRDPAEGNAELRAAVADHARLHPVPAIHPGLPGWEQELETAFAEGAPAVRCDPLWYGLDPAGSDLRRLAVACASLAMPLTLAVKLEDLRQRHPLDRAGDLPASAVRTLVRTDARLKLLITNADRGFIEEVHFGSTPSEAARICWDIGWIWGPPEDHLQILLGTVGAQRFVFGTEQPLRIPEGAVARLDLLDLSAPDRDAIEFANATRFASPASAR